MQGLDYPLPISYLLPLFQVKTSNHRHWKENHLPSEIYPGQVILGKEADEEAQEEEPLLTSKADVKL